MNWDEWFPKNNDRALEVKSYFEKSIDSELTSDLLKQYYLISEYSISGFLGPEIALKIKERLHQKELSKSEFFKCVSLAEVLERSFRTEVSEILKIKYPNWFSQFEASINSPILNGEELEELLNFDLTPDDFLSFHYNEGIKLYLLLDKDRKQPGLFIMKDAANHWVRDEVGELWSLPALASSKHDFPFYLSNGQTPLGVLSIDGVMPEANNQTLFGLNRRLVLNFFPNANCFETTKSLIPDDHKSLNWWRQSEIANLIGRRFLRIHGTGLTCKDTEASFAPFIRTSGCIATREVMNQFNDQRKLLDKIMQAMDLEITYENETMIKGLLYVVEISNESGPIQLEDVRNLVDK